MDNSWVNSVPEEDAAVLVKFFKEGVNSLSEEESAVALKYKEQLRDTNKKKTQETIDTSYQDLFDSFVSTDSLKAAAGGVVGTANAVADTVAGLIKFPFSAGSAIGNLAKGHTPSVAREASREAAESILPSVHSSVMGGTGMGGKYAEGANAAYETLMKPWELLTKAIEAPGKAVGGQSGELLTMALETGMIAAPAAKRIGAHYANKANPLLDASGIPKNFNSNANKAVDDVNAQTAREERIDKEFNRETKPTEFNPEIVPMGPVERSTPYPFKRTTEQPFVEDAIDFPLRQEVLQQPEISAAIDNFRAQAAELSQIVENAINPRVREKAAKNLESLQTEFAAGMKELGISNMADAHGLQRPLYETTARARPVEKVGEFSETVGDFWETGSPKRPINTGNFNQAGAVKFPFGEEKGKDFTPEEIAEHYKKKTGNSLPAEEAINIAKKLNQENAEVFKKLAASTKSELSKTTKNPFLAESTLSPEELKIAVNSGKVKDIDTNVFKKHTGNLLQRSLGSTYSIRAHYNNPILEAVMRPLSEAADRAKYTVDHLLWGTGGVGTIFNTLDSASQTRVWDRLVSTRGKPEADVYQGLSAAENSAVKSLSQAYEKSLVQTNEARVAEGKTPISAEANHIASVWQGDRISMVHDKSGELVGVVTGSKADIEVARNWLAENKPELEMTPDAFRGSAGQKPYTESLAELYDSLITAAEAGEITLTEEVIRRMSEARVMQSANVRGVAQHEKFTKKEKVFGALGLKPWETAEKNAQDGINAQLSHLEAVYQRAELSKAAKTISEYEKVLGNLNAVKVAKTKLAEMQGNGTNPVVKYAEETIRKKLSETKTGGKLLKGAGDINQGMTVAMNVKYFALDPAFAVINLFEVATKTPIAVAHGIGAKEAVSFHAARKTLDFMANLGSKGPEAIKHLKEDDAYAFEFARQRNIGNPTVEVANKVRPKTTSNTAIDYGKNIVDASIKYPELAQRFTAFITTFHAMRAFGLEKAHAANVAHDLTKLYFKDYSPLEAASIFQKFGKVGMTGGRQLRTWLVGEIALLSAQAANKQAGLLTTTMGLSAMMYGADSVPVYQAVDKMAYWAKQLAIWMADDPEEVLKRSELLTPKEMLFINTGRDPRGVVDRGLESIGLEGSTTGRTQWNALPADVTEIFFKIRYLIDSGNTYHQAVKEALKDDPNGAAIAKLLLDPIAPKMITRGIETEFLTDTGGNIRDPGKNYDVSKTIHSPGEKRAYLFGMQPKTTANQKYGESFQFREEEATLARKEAASEELRNALNHMSISKDSNKRIAAATSKFVKAYVGDSANESYNQLLDRVIEESVFTPMQLRRIRTLRNAGNNPALAKYFAEIYEDDYGR